MNYNQVEPDTRLNMKLNHMKFSLTFTVFQFGWVLRCRGSKRDPLKWSDLICVGGTEAGHRGGAQQQKQS